ncbi:hypothetical protein O6H91_01G051500 [Diphasiastrum complanatum]|uniref:Uncharacterized protein n=1 Tax=Diphasiastrum complanatum TaxID=34168 RepID=A0ACC2ER73_DIPCM|nr:hypothetical protein O6H91_01G051500 [Diphasiastrum complanatum]
MVHFRLVDSLITRLMQRPGQSARLERHETTEKASHINGDQAWSRTKELWEDVISNPLQRWDHRSNRVKRPVPYLWHSSIHSNTVRYEKNPRFLDFKHRSTTDKALGVDYRFYPPWLHARLAVIVQGQERGQSGVSTDETSGKVVRVEQLWQEFFSDPSQWSDNRFTKKNSKYPDFKHKSTHEGLWIEGWLNPPWVKAKAATMGLVQIQSGDGLRSRVPNSGGKAGNVSKLCQEGRLKEALHMVAFMVQENVQAPISTYACLLKVCTRRKALAEGKQVHALIVQRGLNSNTFLGNTLVNMYAKCGSVLDARQVFDSMTEHNVFSWTNIISAYANHGKSKEAINLFRQMQQTGLLPNNVTYVVVLKACARIQALEQGKQLHSDIIKSGFESDVIVGSTLVDMYAKCKCIEHARQVFDNMRERDVVSWNTMISGYAQHGFGNEALDLYEKMKQEGVQADNVTFAVLLKACASIAALEQGKQLHLDIIRSGFELDEIVGNTLVDMYAKCGCIEDARQVFNNMHERDVVSWNVIIAGYAQQGLGKEALALYDQMKQEGLPLDDVTYVVLLKACASIAALEVGKQLHKGIIKSGFESDAIIGNTLVDMYAKCGCVEDARQMFNNMHDKNVVSWTAMIAGYAQQGLGKEALALYEQMKKEGVQPNNITYIVLLKACASIAAMEQGKQLHLDIIKSGFQSDVIVGNTLVDMYAKCGCIQEASQVFNSMQERNLVSWNVMIAGYVEQGLGKDALALYERMKQEGLQPDDFTHVVLLKACASIAALEVGKQLHLDILKKGIESDAIVANTLVDMYAKCGQIEDARQVFNSMHERNVVSWTAMIAGYAQQGLGKEALILYKQMKQEGVQPNNVTYVVLLKACASIAALEQGKQLHLEIIESGFESDVTVGNVLVDMYVKCLCIEDARQVFNNMHERNVVSWNAMIMAYAQPGLGKEAVTLLEQMQREGFKPNEVSYINVISACSHSGLVDKGRHLFDSMSKDHGVTPTMDHYACMVDLLCRAGYLADAEDFINEMPIQPNAVVWMTLLGAARNHGQVEVGRRAFDYVVKLEPENAAAYILLSSIYAAVGRRDRAFAVGEANHPQSKEIWPNWID